MTFSQLKYTERKKEKEALFSLLDELSIQLAKYLLHSGLILISHGPVRYLTSRAISKTYFTSNKEPVNPPNLLPAKRFLAEIITTEVSTVSR